MAKRPLGDVAAGLFSESPEPAVTNKAEAKKRKSNPEKKVGRPKAPDLQSGTPLVRKTIYITEEQNKKMAYYGFDNNMDFSATVRMLIDKSL